MIEYVAAPKHFYDDFFKDIVGVSHMKDVRKEHIVICARSLYIYKLMDTPLPPPRPSENGTLRHITVGRAAIATPPEPI